MSAGKGHVVATRGSCLHWLPPVQGTGRPQLRSGRCRLLRFYLPSAERRRNLTSLLQRSVFRLVEGDLETVALDACLEGAAVFHLPAQPGTRTPGGVTSQPSTATSCPLVPARDVRPLVLQARHGDIGHPWRAHASQRCSVASSVTP